MKYGAAAGKTAGKIPAVRLQLLRPAFLPGILVPSDDHRPFILPQIKNTFVLSRLVHQIFFQPHILIRIKTAGFYSIYFLYHNL